MRFFLEAGTGMNARSSELSKIGFTALGNLHANLQIAARGTATWDFGQVVNLWAVSRSPPSCSTAPRLDPATHPTFILKIPRLQEHCSSAAELNHCSSDPGTWFVVQSTVVSERALHASCGTETTGTQCWVTEVPSSWNRGRLFLEGKFWAAMDLGSAYE
jgi:hypothetical protein